MGLIRYYMRVFFRSHFKPINVKTAKNWELRSSLLYFMLSWMAFGFSIKMFSKSAQEGKLGDAKIYDAYQNMLTFGTKKEFSVLEITGSKVERKVFSVQDLEQKVKTTDSE